jgi:hypothetical protein
MMDLGTGEVEPEGAALAANQQERFAEFVVGERIAREDRTAEIWFFGGASARAPACAGIGFLRERGPPGGAAFTTEQPNTTMW